MQSLLFRFLWEGKKARSAFAKLSKTGRARGMGVPVFADYHLAAILAQFRWWILKSPVPLWGEIEQSLIQGGKLYEYTLAYPYLTNTHKDFPLPVLATLQSWKYLTTHQSGSTPKVSIDIHISTLTLFIPDLRVDQWTKKKH